jgi:hypothetical protein
MALTEKFEEFFRSYCETALWSSTDDDGNSLDDKYDVDDITPATLKEMRKDCQAFVRETKADLHTSGLSASRAGHNFWLTRNRHGAGFWDEGLGAIGKRLTDAAHAYGSVDLYVGDDGKIHA